MSIMDDYKQLRMIENIKNLKEMEIAYKANLKLCKYQEQQINKLATCIEEIKEIAEDINDECEYLLFGSCAAEAKNQILQKISECEVGDKIKTVDLGFWDKNGEYKEDIQTVDITKE